MPAYKKTSLRGTDANFPKLERRDLSQSKNQRLSGTYVLRVKMLMLIPLHPIPIAILVMLTNAKQS